MNRISCELGHNISQQRRKCGMTQAQLSLKLNASGYPITVNTVSNWERGVVDIPAYIIHPICHILNCSSWSLYPHSESVSDRDMELIQRVQSLSQDQKDDLYYLLHDWDGDRRALLKLDVIHAVQSKEMRYVPDKMILDGYIDGIKRGGQGIDPRAKISIGYVKKALEQLLEDDSK